MSGSYGTMQQHPIGRVGQDGRSRSTMVAAAMMLTVTGCVAVCSYWAGRRNGAILLLGASGVPLPLEQLDGPNFGDVALPPGVTIKPETSSLWKAYELIKTKEFIDLTHTFSPDIPHWKGFDAENVETKFTFADDGFWAQEFCHVGQWGTHVDPPAHFAEGKRTTDQIEPKEMLLPLVVLDVHEECEQNPDYILSMDDVRGWELKHGQLVPEGSFVAMRTDWSKRWPDAAAMDNRDENGVQHYPAWSQEVLEYLYLKRKVVATGHETTDTDGGLAVAQDDYSLEAWILGQDHYQIELLTNLDKVPEAGALVVASFAKPLQGSGFPARVFAIIP